MYNDARLVPARVRLLSVQAPADIEYLVKEREVLTGRSGRTFVIVGADRLLYRVHWQPLTESGGHAAGSVVERLGHRGEVLLVLLTVRPRLARVRLERASFPVDSHVTCLALCGNLPHTMSSNSLRVSADLFEQALRHGEAMSRSAAQQLEHWARLGAALEASQLTVPQLVGLLNGSPAGAGKSSAGKALASAPEATLWAHKRAQQRRDIASIDAGRSTNAAMSWFSGGRAKRAKAKNSPF